MIIDAEPCVGFGLMAREREMEAIVADEFRQKTLTLGIGHRVIE